MTSRIRCLIAALMVLGGAGCASVHTEQSFPVEKIRSIRPGTTTKQEVLAWFGPPADMARKGGSIRVPFVADDDGGPRDLSFADILGYFPARHQEANLVIYFYQYGNADIPPVYIGFVPVAKAQETVYRLWVLVNEDTGVVADSVLRTLEPRGMR